MQEYLTNILEEVEKRRKLFKPTHVLLSDARVKPDVHAHFNVSKPIGKHK